MVVDCSCPAVNSVLFYSTPVFSSALALSEFFTVHCDMGLFLHKLVHCLGTSVFRPPNNLDVIIYSSTRQDSLYFIFLKNLNDSFRKISGIKQKFRNLQVS